MKFISIILYVVHFRIGVLTSDLIDVLFCFCVVGLVVVVVVFLFFLVFFLINFVIVVFNAIHNAILTYI